MSISVELLWSNDPLPINEIIENPTVVVNLPIGGTIITSNVTQSYVDDQDALLQDQINTKLDASEYNQHFKGVYVDLAALQIAIPTANDGDYAHIDLGVGSDREVAIWDNDDAIWVASTGSVASTTDEVAEGSTNRYFTETRVRATPLTGFTPSPNSPVLSTDQLLAAIGKLQAQINNIAPPTWVSAASIGTVHSSLTGMEFAKINGNLWVRGRYQSADSVTNGSTLFTLTNAGYRIEAPESGLSDLLIGQVLLSIGFISPQYLDLLGMINPKRYYFKLRNRGSFDPVASPNYAVIQPTPIGKLLTP